MMKYPLVTALAGGVGGAKLVYGLSKILPPDNLNVIVNTGDDFDYCGLHVSPDIDSIVYSLAEISDPIKGYGRANDSFKVMEEIKNFGEDVWFRLGDLDLALNLYRTKLLQSGFSLTETTKKLCKSLKIGQMILPMSDDQSYTKIITDEFGKLDFQDYFVKYKFEPKVENIDYSNIENSKITTESLTAIVNADIIVFCPSNPWLSIFPILRLPGVEKEILKKNVIAISPIIGNNAVKGPAAKLFIDFGFVPSALAVAEVYKDFITYLIIDSKNMTEIPDINKLGIKTYATDIMMGNNDAKIRLAGDLLKLIENFLQ